MEPTIPLFSYISNLALKHKGMFPEKDIPILNACYRHLTIVHLWISGSANRLFHTLNHHITTRYQSKSR